MRRAIDLLMDEPQDDETWVHEALIAWGFWCHDRPWRAGCVSAEGRYRPPAQALFNPPEPRPRSFVRPEDTNSALLGVPGQHREALVLRYYMLMPDRIICRIIALRPTAYQRFMRDARLMIRNVLQSRGVVLIIPVHNPVNRRSGEAAQSLQAG